MRRGQRQSPRPPPSGTRRGGGALRALLSAAALAAALTPETGASQSPPPGGPADARRDGERTRDEVVVTARRREERLEDAPLSVSALSQLELLTDRATRVDAIGRLAPNLQFDAHNGERSGARIQIRGVGNDDPIASRDPGVGLYLDGVYLARPQGGLFGLVDVERIEVLRGPQGTLFGRNTVGGAIHVVTRKPTDAFEASARVSVGNLNLLESRSVLNWPLVPERAALRLAVQTTTREGYSRNRLTGQHTDDQRFLGARVALRVQPSDRFELLLTGEQTRTHQAGRAGECRHVPDALPDAPLLQAMESSPNLAPIADCIAEEADGREFEFRSPIRTRENVDTYGLSATLTAELDAARLRSTSAWRRQVVEFIQDFSFMPTELGVALWDPGEFDQVSQELNASGEALAGRLRWTAGIFGFYEKVHQGRQLNRVAFPYCQELSQTAALLDGEPGGVQALLVEQTATAVCGASSISRRPHLSTFALASYSHASFALSERFELAAGLRYSRERKQMGGSERRFVRGGAPAAPAQGLPATEDVLTNSPFPSRSERYSKWTPALSLRFSPTPDLMLYASYSRGFKSGGFNGRPSADAPLSLQPFAPEVLDSFELGLKGRWLDGRLAVRAAVFHGIYEDIQQTILTRGRSGQFVGRVANAAEAAVSGAELELLARWDALDLQLGLGFTNARYRDFEHRLEVPGAGLELVDRKDEPFFNTPRFTGTLRSAYTFRNWLSLGDLTVHARWYHQEQVRFGRSSDTVDQGRFGLLGARLALALPDGVTEIALWGENLLDRRYLSDGISFELGFARSLAYYGAPRTYGVEIRRAF